MSRIFFLIQLLLLLLHAIPSIAQDYPRADYNWEPNRKITYQPTDSELKMPAVILLDNRFIDCNLTERGTSYNGIYRDTHQRVKNIPSFKEYYETYCTRHFIVRLNDDKGIKDFSKLFIQLNGEAEIVRLKVRIISSDGSVIELSKEQLKDNSDCEKYQDYKAFAVENITKGSELEYLYTVWRKAITYGTETFQGDYPLKQGKIVITTPDSIIVATKTYNNFPEPVRKITNNHHVLIVGNVENIPPLIKEPFSLGNSNPMKMTYRLIVDTTNNYKHSKWSNVCTNTYKNLVAYNIGVDLAGYLKELKLNELPKEKQLVAIESFLKKSIKTTACNNDFSYSDPDYVLKHKNANREGILRLYVAFFKQLNIPFKIVRTSNINEEKFDPEHPEENNFGEILFYFPFSGKYIAPFYKTYQYGFPPSNVSFNYGLFIDTIEKGKIAVINGMEMNNNFEMLKAEVVIDTNINAVKVNEQFKCSGYRATEIAVNYNGDDKIEKEKTIESFKKNRGISDEKILNEEIDVQTIDTTGVKKLSVNTNYQSNALIQKSGKNYVLNIGHIINQQRHLQKQEVRVNDIDILYPIKYYRTIKLKVPAGYKLKGLEQFNIDKGVIGEGENRTCRFTSGYTLNGDELDINILEYYSTVYYPKEKYPDFCDVVNAAADFNKLQLVLEKE